MSPRPRRTSLLATAGLFLCIALACGKGGDTAEPTPEGTWRDSDCGLVWQQELGDSLLWADAIGHCEQLSLGDLSWRLPGIGELRCLVNGCEATALEGDCDVADDCTDLGCITTACEGCEPASDSLGCYWSSQIVGECDDPLWSASAMSDELSWVLHFRDGGISHDDVTERHAVLCVSDG
jgi:hypothetical protein